MKLILCTKNTYQQYIYPRWTTCEFVRIFRVMYFSYRYCQWTIMRILIREWCLTLQLENSNESFLWPFLDCPRLAVHSTATSTVSWSKDASSPMSVLHTPAFVAKWVKDKLTRGAKSFSESKMAQRMYLQATSQYFFISKVRGGKENSFIVTPSLEIFVYIVFF